MTSTLTDLRLGSDDGLDTRAVQLSICRVNLMGKLMTVVANEMRACVILERCNVERCRVSLTMTLRCFLFSLFILPSLHAAVIGTSQPAQSITAARIAALPAKDRAAWMAYLERSQ